MMAWRLVLLFVNACLLTPSLQCGCPLQYTQSIVCYSKLIVEVTVNSVDETSDPYNTIYGVTVDNVIYGDDEFATLTDKTIIKTPNENSMCGPVSFIPESKRIVTVSTLDKVMAVSFCDYIADAATISRETKENLSGVYQKNCDCEIPIYGRPMMPSLAVIGTDCGNPPDTCGSSWDLLCYKDTNGQCKFDC